MKTNDSNNRATALLDLPDERIRTQEVIFPADDAILTDKELAELLSHDAHPKTAIQADSDPEQKEFEDNEPRTKKLFLLASLAVIALAVTVYLYLQTRPKPVPAPSVDLTSTATNTAPNSMPDTAFQISPEKQQLIGVQYGTVEYSNISKSLHAVGRAAYDETQITRINPKVEGWIENVFVDFTGKLVQKGQPLLSIYSPDLVQTQEEYLLAIKGKRELGESPFDEAVKFSESLAQSAKRRLELWDINEDQIQELEKRGTPSRTMTLYAPASGFVMTRNAFPRQRVMPDTELYQLADLSNIWIVADIYEFEAADIKLGQPATVTLSSYPGREFHGKITYIYPHIDNATRTLKVRLELANKDFAIKPEMFADVTFRITYGTKLVVPQEAVMDSGLEQLVFVAHDRGYFEPRKVQIGAKVDEKYVVLAGLQAGDRVVTSGNFLIDSESKLQSATGGMGMPGMDHGAHKEPAIERSTPKAPAIDRSARKAPVIDHSSHK
ncbi:MAG TPA: efflux RND transporter periplasmic adaptor subunit [Pyrinomonadaceae bacterium]|nr:efflux RND transporter periplasmic adaptor subunit [Pyrinomonadaceae bacterium]